MLWGLQSSVTSRFWSGRVAAWLASGAMSPRVQNPGVQVLGLHIFPLSGSTCGGTGVGDGQVWSALAAAGIRIARPSATRNGTRLLPSILPPLPFAVSAFASIDPPSTVRSRSVVACAATGPLSSWTECRGLCRWLQGRGTEVLRALRNRAVVVSARTETDQ